MTQLFKDLNIRPETITLLEENTGNKLLDMHLGFDFFGYDTGSKGNKNKQVGTAKKLLHSKGNHQQNEKDVPNRRKYFQIMYLELISKIYKELI